MHVAEERAGWLCGLFEVKLLSLTFRCPLYNITTEGGRTLSVKTVVEWNTLPVSLKQSRNVKSIRKKLHKELLAKQRKILTFCDP